MLWNRNRNRNRRNRNFLTSGTGTWTGTVTCLKVGTGTPINYGSRTGTRFRIMYLTFFIHHFFPSHFSINLLKFINFFLVKTAYYVKRQKCCPKFFLKNLLFMVWIWSWNRNRKKEFRFHKAAQMLNIPCTRGQLDGRTQSSGSPPVWPSCQRVNDGKARAAFTHAM